MLINSRFKRHVKQALDCGEHRRFEGRVRLRLPRTNHPRSLVSGLFNMGVGLFLCESLPCPKAVKGASPQSKSTPGRVGNIANIRRLLLAIRLLLATSLVCISPVARGAILERLKNGENLTVAAIGTSLTATDWGFWFQPTGDWLNGQGFPGKVTLANRAVCG
jgi:hypothetical protein